MLLEKETNKLKADAMQAEKAIKNYRSFLSQRQVAGDEVHMSTTQTQTDAPGASDLEVCRVLVTCVAFVPPPTMN
jgi:hypothetical protein